MTRVESLKNFQEAFPDGRGMGPAGRELAIVGLLEQIAGSLEFMPQQLVPVRITANELTQDVEQITRDESERKTE